MEKIITVEGEANVKAYCDRVLVSIKASAEDVDFDKAIVAVKETLMKYLGRISSPQFSAEIIWSGVVLDRLSNRSSRRGSSDNQPKYRATQVIGFDMAWDASNIATLLVEALRDEAFEIESVKAYVSNPQPFEDEATRDAVKEATRYADVICTSAGSKRGELLSIEVCKDRPSNHAQCAPNLQLDDLVLDIQDDSELARTISVVAENLVMKQVLIYFADKVRLQFAINQ